jgi:hypothetical protein
MCRDPFAFCPVCGAFCGRPAGRGVTRSAERSETGSSSDERHFWTDERREKPHQHTLLAGKPLFRFDIIRRLAHAE